MKILVTVGSSSFDALIRAVDKQFGGTEYQLLCQVGKDGYQPLNHPSFEFAEDFSKLWQDVDVVICHGGGATVFELLEAGKKIVVVPNLARIDVHQQDLANFVEQQQLGMVCRDMSQLSQCVVQCAATEFKPYVKEPFFMAQSILTYFEIPQS